MREFYLFKIKEEYIKLTKNNPFILYSSLESIYNLKEDYLKQANNYYKQIREKLNINKINNYIYENNKNEPTYIKYHNSHLVNNYFTKENTRLEINNTYMYLKTNIPIPTIITSLNEQNIFICDFQNKDYFWLDDIGKVLANQ